MNDLSPGVRSLLRAANGCDDPSPEDAARVKRAVLARVGAVGITAAVVTASSSQAKAASVLSLAAKLTAALAVTAGGVAATWSIASQPEPVTVTASTPHEAKPAPRMEEGRDGPAPSAPATVPEPPKVQPQALPSKRPPRASRNAEKVGESPGPSAAALEAEMKMIRGADAALRAGRATEALGLLAQHQADHPRAALAQEREGLRAIANCQLGANGSLAAARRFLEGSPHSPLVARLKSACRVGD